MQTPEHILISRTDGIGDVILTLPVAAALKACFPQVRITFLGRGYTRPIIEHCAHVDAFADWDLAGDTAAHQRDFLNLLEVDTVLHVFPRKEVVEAAFAARIPVRVATARRWHTLMKVNRRLWFSRKGADLHEAQLNLKMLDVLNCEPSLDLKVIGEHYGLSCAAKAADGAPHWADAPFKILIHPRSHGSAVEYPLERYADLIEQLHADGIAVGITGTEKERAAIGEGLPWDRVTDFTGRLSLEQLMQLIAYSDGLVAASTGPLHIAAALGKPALGLFSPKRPIHPGRWQPLGPKAEYLVSETHPEDGKLQIKPSLVAARIREWKASR
jgi:ADP-heptose:LPS heptosyltransferase